MRALIFSGFFLLTAITVNAQQLPKGKAGSDFRSCFFSYNVGNEAGSKFELAEKFREDCAVHIQSLKSTVCKTQVGMDKPSCADAVNKAKSIAEIIQIGCFAVKEFDKNDDRKKSVARCVRDNLKMFNHSFDEGSCMAGGGNPVSCAQKAINSFKVVEKNDLTKWNANRAAAKFVAFGYEYESKIERIEYDKDEKRQVARQYTFFTAKQAAASAPQKASGKK